MFYLIESPFAGGIPPPPSSEAWRFVSWGSCSHGRRCQKRPRGINSPQNDTKMTPRDPKMAPRSTKMASRGPQEGPRWTPRWPEKAFKRAQEWESRDSKGKRKKKNEKWFCVLKFWGGFQGPRSLKIELPSRRELDFHFFDVSQKTTSKRKRAR